MVQPKITIYMYSGLGDRRMARQLSLGGWLRGDGFVTIVAVLDVDGVADKYLRKSIPHNYNVFLVADFKVQHD